MCIPLWINSEKCLQAIIPIFAQEEFVLIACNAKWDKDNKIDEIIDSYLKHITDSSPITARQCIKCLPAIARCKPDLRSDILRALEKADVAVYHESMRILVWKDIRKALTEIRRLGGEWFLL